MSSHPYAQFARNLAYARNMVTGGRALEGLRGIGSDYGDLAAAHPEDLYRAAWSQAVSALDHWMHEEVRQHAVALVRSEERPLPERLRKLRMPFSTVEQLAEDSVGSVFEEFIDAEIRRDTYQRSRGISEGLRLVTHLNTDEIWDRIGQGLGTERGRARARQDEVVERRNHIAHRADLDRNGRRRPMTASEVTDAVAWIEDVAHQIDRILTEAAPKAPEPEALAWLVRGGKEGRSEDWALEHGMTGIGFHPMGDLTLIDSRDQMVEAVELAYTGESRGTVTTNAGQLWTFRARIQTGDLVVMPLRKTPTLAIGRVTGDYLYVGEDPDGTRHRREVEWIRTDVPRAAAGEDLRTSLKSRLTVCSLWRNDAARRLAEMARTGSDPGPRDAGE